MNIVEKCKFITEGKIIVRGWFSKEPVLNLEIYSELRNEIINKLEELANPIIEEYKKCKKNMFYNEWDIEIDKDPRNSNINQMINEKRNEINRYLGMLQDVDERISKIQQQYNNLPVID